VGFLQNVTSGGARNGSAFVKNSTGGRLLFRDTGAVGRLRKFSSGNKISANLGGPAGTWENGNVKLFSRLITAQGVTTGGGWTASMPGFGGFEISTANHKVEYGWVRLAFIEGQGGLPVGIEALDWAYDPSGAPVIAGQTSSPTPEPGTGALALLAAGAVGVSALRRRRQSA
jgi:MYXO-CTERM domain-containing protein